MMETAGYSLSVNDYVAYNQRICRRRLGWPLVVAITVIAMLSVADYGVDGVRNAVFALVVGLIVLALYLFVLVPRYARGIFSEQPSLSEPRTITLDDESIEFQQASGRFRTEWRSIIQWDETHRLLVLYVNRIMFIAIPKADIGEDMAMRIRESLIKSGLAAPLR